MNTYTEHLNIKVLFFIKYKSKKMKVAFLLSVCFVQSWAFIYELKTIKVYGYFFITVLNEHNWLVFF